MPINDPEKSENMRKSIRVYSGSSNRPLAQKIAEYLGVELSGLTLKQFANGEIYARYDETVRGADVFLIQSVAGGNVNDAGCTSVVKVNYTLTPVFQTGDGETSTDIGNVVESNREVAE